MDGPSADGRARTRWLFVALATTGTAILVGGVAAMFALRPAAEPPAVTVTTAVSPETTLVPTPLARTATPSLPPSVASTPSSTASVQPAPGASPAVTAMATNSTGSSTPTPPAATTATASSSPAPAPSAPPTPVSSPSPLAAGAAPFVLAPTAAGVGETFLVRVFAADASAVAVELSGKSYALTAAVDRFWGVIGVPVDAAPGLRTLRVTARAASGAIQGTAESPLLIVEVRRPVDYLELTEEQSSVLTEDAAAIELTIRSTQFASFDAGKRWTGRFQMPVFGPQTTAFGQGRSINGGPVGGFHSGMDIGAEAGTVVRAAAEGRVASVVRMPIRGLSVVIDHGSGVKSGYHHMEATLVTEGEIVTIGHPIGRVGSTGLSTGPHLHWEVLVWGVNVDPLQWTAEPFEP